MIAIGPIGKILKLFWNTARFELYQISIDQDLLYIQNIIYDRVSEVGANLYSIGKFSAPVDYI